MYNSNFQQRRNNVLKIKTSSTENKYVYNLVI